METSPPTTPIAVVGSLNMDFVVSVECLPGPGETVLGGGFRMVAGGKGANQACAAARLSKSGSVRMIGCTGYDLFADHLKASLSATGVDIRHVRASRSASTGVAMIAVDGSGQNSIVVAPGANHALLPADMEAARAAFDGAAMALFQLETPLETVEAGLRQAAHLGARTMLDPAPAQPLGEELLRQVSILTPNESEACALLQRPSVRMTVEDAREAARTLLQRGVRAVALKLGDQGCFWADASLELHCPAFAIDPVDATAAGDTFNGALAVALAEGRPVAEAIRFANAAAALSVMRAGAQPSIPTRGEVDVFLRR
jgi:ribokinase